MTAPRLVDVNVWLALLASNHSHHAAALAWYDVLEANEAGLCRVVQLSLVRLFSNASVMGPNTISTLQAWDVTQNLLDDERVVFWPEPSSVSAILPKLLRHPFPTPNLLTDAYLAAFAMAKECRMTTLDRGFRQFAGLILEEIERK
jgi:toxin-antitoxin system PIN domain toxin